MSQHIHEEFEVGQYLDQAHRETLMAVSQLVERLQRSMAERDRAAAQAIRESLREPDGESMRRSSRARMLRAVEEALGVDAEFVLPATDSQNAYLSNVGLRVDDPDLSIAEAHAILNGFEEGNLQRGDLQGAANLLATVRTEGLAEQATEEAPLSPASKTDPASKAAPKPDVVTEVAPSKETFVIPAYRGNKDRGVAPSKAGSPVEAEHRRQTWNLARKEWEAEHPELTTQQDREAAWTALPIKDKTDRFWKQYDTEEARTVPDLRTETEKLHSAYESENRRRAAAVDQGEAPEVAPSKETFVIPAYRGNKDRGVAPSKAGSPVEAEHRRQTWNLARKEWEAEHPELTTQQDREAAWTALPIKDKTDRFWKQYDTEEARTVPDLRTETESGSAALATQEQTDTPKRTKDELGARQPSPSVRGFAPNKAPNAAEAEHRRRSWQMAEAGFVEERAAMGATPAEAQAAWRDLDWQDRALRYWTAYDDPASNPAAVRATVAGGAGVALAAEAVELSRERVIELNEQAAQWFVEQAGPGSKGMSYFEDRLGSDGLAQLQGWVLGYAPEGWTGLSDHLRQAGATSEELVASGLARVSSRGGVIDAFRDRAVIAIRDVEGATVGFVGRDLSGSPQAPKYINSGETPAFRKGDHLLGLAEAASDAHIVRVEGPFDALAISAAGDGTYAGVAPMGTALTDTQADLLAQRASNGRVWAALDGDLAGYRATEKDFWALHDRGVDVLSIPLAHGEDPASMWKDNPDLLRTHLDVAEFAPSAAFIVLDSAIADAEDALRAGEQEAVENFAWTRDQIARGVDPEKVALLDRYAEQALERLHEQPTPSPVQRTVGAPEPDPRYNRGEAPSLAGVTDHEAVEARKISGLGFARPTADMLQEAGQRAGRRAHPQRSSQSGRDAARRRSL